MFGRPCYLLEADKASFPQTAELAMNFWRRNFALMTTSAPCVGASGFIDIIASPVTRTGVMTFPRSCHGRDGDPCHGITGPLIREIDRPYAVHMASTECQVVCEMSPGPVLLS